MSLSLHTYDIGMFGSIFVPSNPVIGIGLCHWMIATVIFNLMSDDPTKLKILVDEVCHAMDHYLKRHWDAMTEDEIQYVFQQSMCYYVNVENYFQNVKPVEHIDLPSGQKGVAIILKD